MRSSGRAAAGAVLAIVLGLSAAAGAAPLYTLLDLGTLNPAEPENYSHAYDVNELGQVVGSSNNSEGRSEAFRTAPNAPINPLTDGLGTLGGLRRGSEAFAINDRGQVVGWVTEPNPPNDTPHAFFTEPNQRIASHMGTFTGGTVSYAFAINNAGQVAGYSSTVPTPSDPNRAAIRAFRTSSSRPLDDSNDLGTLSASAPRTVSAAYGVNERGQVAGWSFNSKGQAEAFRTAPNVPIAPSTDGLGTLGGDSQATAINLQGQVVGYSDLLGGGFVRHAFRTSPDAPINTFTDDLGTLGGARSFATDINDFGIVVGNSTAESDRPGNLAPDHAFVYINGEGMLDLNNLIANRMPEGWTLAYAEGINNRGQIVGTAEVLTPNGFVTRSFLLTPVPEPALAFLPLTALVFAGRTIGRRGRAKRTAGRSGTRTLPRDRRTMRRGLFLARLVCPAFLALTAVAPALAEVRYQVTSLGQFIPTGINEHGQVSGYTGGKTRDNPGWQPSDQHAALWLPAPAYGLAAGLNDLGNPSAPVGTAAALDINDLGQITAGYSGLWLPSPAYGHPAGWSRIVDPGWAGLGIKINNSGQVAGSNPSLERALLWLPEPANGLPAGTHVLDIPGTRGSGSVDINAAGQVVGYNKTSPGIRPFLYLPAAAYGMPAGTYILPRLPGAIDAWPLAINDRGQVTGMNIYDPYQDPPPHAFLWLPEDDAANGRPAGLYDLDLISSARWYLYPTDINNAGYIIGVQNTPSADGQGSTFIWDPTTGRISDLDSLVDPALGWHFTNAIAMNDSGQIVGWGTRNGVQQGVLLSVPEPAPLSLLAIAGVCGLRRRRHHRTIAPRPQRKRTGRARSSGDNDTIDAGRGGNGDDTFFCGAGATSDGADIMNGGGGTDTADYHLRTANLAVSIDGLANDGADEGDNVKTDVENVNGGGGNDTLIGTTGANRLVGNAGADVLWGEPSGSSSGGNDTIIGGDGNDWCYGGYGADVVDGDDPADLTKPRPAATSATATTPRSRAAVTTRLTPGPGPTWPTAATATTPSSAAPATTTSGAMSPAPASAGTTPSTAAPAPTTPTAGTAMT